MMACAPPGYPFEEELNLAVIVPQVAYQIRDMRFRPYTLGTMRFVLDLYRDIQRGFAVQPIPRFEKYLEMSAAGELENHLLGLLQAESKGNEN